MRRRVAVSRSVGQRSTQCEALESQMRRSRNAFLLAAQNRVCSPSARQCDPRIFPVTTYVVVRQSASRRASSRRVLVPSLTVIFDVPNFLVHLSVHLARLRIVGEFLPRQLRFALGLF
jgi:hypothetical protein